MRDAYQLHEGIGGADLRGVGIAIEGVAQNRLASWRQLLFRAWPNQGANFVSALKQLGDQRAADVTGAAGDKDAMGLRGHKAGVSLR